MRIGVIGGTGIYNLDILKNTREVLINTAFGDAKLRIGEYKGEEIAFLARHGISHNLLPHLVNYKANIAALKILGIKKVIGTAAVGTMREDIPPGEFALLDQFVDFTKLRDYTYFHEKVVHMDFTHPYCENLRNIIIKASENSGINMARTCCYGCTQGPRFETPAEIRMMKQLGADVVGMTNVPEVVLAKEAELCYSCVAISTNWAAGMSNEAIDSKDVDRIMSTNGDKFKRLITSIFDVLLSNFQDCECNSALSEIRKEKGDLIRFE